MELLREPDQAGLEGRLPCGVPKLRRREVEAIDYAIVVRIGGERVRRFAVQSLDLIEIREAIPVGVGTRWIREEPVKRDSVQLFVVGQPVPAGVHQTTC